MLSSTGALLSLCVGSSASIPQVSALRVYTHNNGGTGSGYTAGSGSAQQQRFLQTVVQAQAQAAAQNGAPQAQNRIVAAPAQRRPVGAHWQVVQRTVLDQPQTLSHQGAVLYQAGSPVVRSVVVGQEDPDITKQKAFFQQIIEDPLAILQFKKFSAADIDGMGIPGIEAAYEHRYSDFPLPIVGNIKEFTESSEAYFTMKKAGFVNPVEDQVAISERAAQATATQLDDFRKFTHGRGGFVSFADPWTYQDAYGLKGTVDPHAVGPDAGVKQTKNLSTYSGFEMHYDTFERLAKNGAEMFELEAAKEPQGPVGRTSFADFHRKNAAFLHQDGIQSLVTLARMQDARVTKYGTEESKAFVRNRNSKACIPLIAAMKAHAKDALADLNAVKYG